MANKPLAPDDLVALLKKKLSLLHEMLQLSQKQQTFHDMIELDALFVQKDQCMESLQKTDAVIEVWYSQYPRDLHEKEQQLIEQLQLLIQDLWESEQQFETILNAKKAELSSQLYELQDHSQIKNYLGASKSSGRLLNVRK